MYYRWKITASQKTPDKVNMITKSRVSENPYTFMITGTDKIFNINLYCEMEAEDGSITYAFTKFSILNKIYMEKEPLSYSTRLSTFAVSLSDSVATIFNKATILENMKSDLLTTIYFQDAVGIKIGNYKL